MKLRLSHKGLLLVSMVLLFELLLTAVFAGLLDRSEKELEHGSLATSVVTHIDKVRKLFLSAELSVATQKTTRNITYSESAEMLPYEFHALRLFLKDDEENLKELQGAQQVVDTELNRLEAQEKLGQPPFSDVYFKQSSEDLAKRLELIAKDYRRSQEFIPDAETQSRRVIENSVLVVVMLNAMVAVATTIFFMQSIVGRLGILTENSLRFSRGEQLHPTIEGSDEIALLDQTLHEVIGERTLAENMLKENEARTRSLIENMPVGVVTIDEKGIIESINPKIEQIFGYEFAEIVGDHLMALFSLPPETNEKAFTAAVYQQALGSSAEFESRRKSGEIFPIEMSLTEYQSIDGTRYLATLQDITDRHRTEQLKQELLAMVSHDLRSPLTSVQGVMTLLTKGMYGKLNETGESRVKVAEQSLSRLINLVDDILDLEKMEAGKLQFNQDIVPVSSIVDRSIESVYDFAAQQNLSFDVRTANTDIFVDEDRMVQVLVNLLSNAIKYSPAGSAIRVEVTDNIDDVEVCVIDTGPGISFEHQETIFQRFHQVESSNGAAKGTGLGLAISKAIVDGHGGAIGVRSEKGKGSTFWLRLPKPSKKVQAPPAPAERAVS
jgi:PAS domain S-box-containing protein